jgi:hypothetical protein
MPVFELQGPNGETFEVDAPDEGAALSAFQKYSAPQESAQSRDARDQLSAMTQNPRVVTPPVMEDRGSFNAATQGSKSGVFGGFDDEIAAGIRAPIAAGADWLRGDGFNLGDNYTRIQKELQAEKDARRAQHPVASIGGEITGGLALGGNLAKNGITLAGKSVPVLASKAPNLASIIPAAAEGAAYGGVYGAGEANPGERLSGAASGAAIGGLTAGTLQGVGNLLATRSAQKVANATAPTSDDLAGQARQFYKASEAEGVKFKQGAVEQLGQRLKSVAGEANQHLRPKTTGYIDEIERLFKSDMTLEAFDDFRKGLNAEMRRAGPSDMNRLKLMKQTLDNFADSVNSSAFTGDLGKANTFLKGARENWAKSAKTETIEKILDSAEVDGAGKYTQSGFANAIRKEMRSLYKAVQKGKEAGWSKDEISLIRQMAMGGSNSRLVNLMAKFDPRGVVSIAAGQLVGSTLPGVGNVAVPLAGHIAGKTADAAALRAAQSLMTGAATGAAPVAPQVARRAAPFIGGSVAASTGIPRLLEALQPPRRGIPTGR